jgi:prepilin-type N-terminal cleavage/methylation domain-containing protein
MGGFAHQFNDWLTLFWQAGNMKKQGFTLLELSIVLVIIGLLVGGITVGASLIEEAEMRSTIAKTQEIQLAFRAYRLKYNAVPGDHRNAYDYFDGSGGSSICGDNTNTLAGCNGNGDLKWRNDRTKEGFRAWQHMALAKMLKGSFTGVAEGGGIGDAKIDVNVPGTPIDGIGYSFWDHNDQAYSDTQWILSTYGRVMMMGTKMNNGLYENWGLTPAQALSYDEKTDDGKPGSGPVMSYHKNSCTTTSDPATAVYNVSLNDNPCVMVFKLETQ